MNYLKRVLTVFLGTWLTAIGVLLFIQSGKGIDPISTFVAGLVIHFPIQFGTMIQIFNISLLLLMLVLDRKLVGVGSVINAFFVGFFVNLFGDLFTLEVFSYINEYIYMILAPIFLGVGVAIYLSANLGVASLESLMIYF